MVRCPRCQSDSADHLICDRCQAPLTPAPAPPPPDDDLDLLDLVLAECRSWRDLLEPLHAAGLVWLGFTPERLYADPPPGPLNEATARVCRAGACPDGFPVRPAWSPPEVRAGEPVGAATDVYHVALSTWYRLAGLWPAGFAGEGLEGFDFEIPPLRIWRPNLPPGVIPVLERALARDPQRRPPSVGAFVASLEQAVERVGRRYSGPMAVRCRSAGHSVVGAAHRATEVPNQDSFRLDAGERELLAVVADGVSLARIGSGELASRIVCEVLGQVLPRRLRQARGVGEVAQELRDGCIDASRLVLERSLALEPVAPDTDPADLMSSTVLVGYLRNGVLSLASAGDSRAYLVADGAAEQLTVDGDVRSARLAAGATPEEVRALGSEAGALYRCMGVGRSDGAGSFLPSLSRSTPQMSHWPMRPGDVVVLCTDGLVEEGFFLEPADLVEIVGQGADATVEEVAARLVEAAQARQREPSEEEPTGFGDDVTCVVLRIEAP